VWAGLSRAQPALLPPLVGSCPSVQSRVRVRRGPGRVGRPTGRFCTCALPLPLSGMRMQWLVVSGGTGKREFGQAMRVYCSLMHASLYVSGLTHILALSCARHGAPASSLSNALIRRTRSQKGGFVCRRQIGGPQTCRPHAAQAQLR